jgi:CDP-glycerol glycerophosphotransferase
MQKVDDKKIVFRGSWNMGYTCNLKYICEKLLENKIDCEIVFLVTNPKMISKEIFADTGAAHRFDETDNEGEGKKCKIRFGTIGTPLSFAELSSAKVIISNTYLYTEIDKGWRKKKNQYYIQTWHGSLGIKRLQSNLLKIKKRDYKIKQLETSYTDCLLSNSDFESAVFKQEWNYEGNLLLSGHPRNDIFFETEERKKRIKKEVYSRFQLESNVNLVLYAPTFRDDKRFDNYDLDVEGLLSALKSKFGGEWILAIRIHPNLLNYANYIFNFGRKVLNVSYYGDMQELLSVSDVLITDYSSCIFDFMLSKKPGFIFATDIDKYNDERSFYYKLEDTPFPIAQNNGELAENIKNFDGNKYKAEIDLFLKGKGCIEDGKAAERIVELIKNVLDNKI